MGAEQRAQTTAATLETLTGRNTSRFSDSEKVNARVHVADAQSAMDRLTAVPTDPGFVLDEMTLLPLRALMARAHGDEGSYRNCRDRYRAMAILLGFEGHIARAESMT